MRKKETINLTCPSCEHLISLESENTESQIVCSACGADVNFDSTAQEGILITPLSEIENKINMQGAVTMPPPPQSKASLPPPPPPPPKVTLPPPPPPLQPPPLLEIKKTSPVNDFSNAKLTPTAELIQTSCVSVTRGKISSRLNYVVLGLLFLVGIAAGGYFIWMKIDKNNRDLITKNNRDLIITKNNRDFFIITKNSQIVNNQYNILQERNKKKVQLAEKEKEARLAQEEKEKEARLAQEEKNLREKAEDLNIKNAESIKKYKAAMARIQADKAATQLALDEQTKERELEDFRNKVKGVGIDRAKSAKKVEAEKALLESDRTSLDEADASLSLFGEWRLETRSYNENITFNANGKYVSVLEYTRGSPAGTSSKFSGTWKIDGDELVQTRNGNTLKAKIRMTSPTSFEEPSDDRNWPRIWTKVVQKEIKSDTPMGEQKRIVESFIFKISENDRLNSNGGKLTDPVLILMQDRANVHRFQNPDGDDVDQFFKLADNRAKMRSFLENGSFPEDVRKSILSGNGVKLKIKVYINDGKTCVDVSHEEV